MRPKEDPGRLNPLTLRSKPRELKLGTVVSLERELSLRRASADSAHQSQTGGQDGLLKSPFCRPPKTPRPS